MSATEHDKDRTSRYGIENLIGTKLSEGDDRQLPGIGHRRDRPTLPSAQELPAQQTATPMRGQAQFLLTGLSTLVPIAAFTMPIFRRLFSAARHDDSLEARLTALTAKGHTSASNLISRTPSVQSHGGYRLSISPALLFGALISGGATLLYLSRQSVKTEADPQQSPSTEQLPPEMMGHQTPVPMVSGAVKEVAVTMVNRAQEILSEARNAGDERSDQQQMNLPSAARAEARTVDKLGETGPVAATPAATTLDSHAEYNTSAITPPISAQQSEEPPTASPSVMAAATVEMPTHTPQQPESTTPPSPRIAKSAAETTTTAPQPAKVDSDTAVPTEELQAQIKEHMSVLDSKGMRMGAVDRVEVSGSIKLTKDGQGKHHWLPLRWVTRVDTQVHLSRTVKQARWEWKTSAPRTD